MADRGIELGQVELNLAKMMQKKENSVNSLTKGIEFLFKKNKVDYLRGHGRLRSTHEIEVLAGDNVENVIKAKNIILATGSEVTPFPGIEINESTIVSSTGALSLKKVPEKMIVIGGGIIGLELGSVWSRLGAQVTVVEYLDSIGAGMDTEMATAFLKLLKKQGLQFKLGTKVNGASITAEDKLHVNVESSKSGKADTLEADVVLVSVGRRPYTLNLGLESVGIQLDNRGRIEIDDHLRVPSHPHIFAIGDVVKGAMLAHKAEEEGIAVAEYIAQGFSHVNYDCIPSVIYTHPEVAWCGKTEEQVKQSGTKYKVGSFPFAANSRAKTNGMFKLTLNN